MPLSRQANRPRFVDYSPVQQRTRKYLELYVEYNNRVKLLLDRRKAYSDEVYSIQSPVLSGMPRASNLPSDLSSKLISMLSLTSEIDKEIEVLAYNMYLIRSKIQEIDNADIRTAIELKYIDGLYHKEIIETMHSNSFKVSKLLASGIDKLAITESELARALSREKEKDREK